MNTQQLVTWPTGASYAGETFRVMRHEGRDVTIMDREGNTFIVSKACVVSHNA